MNYRLFGTVTIWVPDNSAPFATIRDFGNDDSGLDVYNNSGLWQREFGTSIRTSARNYRLFGTTTIRVPFIQIVVNCHFYGIKHILFPSPESSLPKSRIIVTKVPNCRLYGVPNRRDPELSGYQNNRIFLFFFIIHAYDTLLSKAFRLMILKPLTLLTCL
jgi:hypothetical protein